MDVDEDRDVGFGPDSETLGRCMTHPHDFWTGSDALWTVRWVPWGRRRVVPVGDIAKVSFNLWIWLEMRCWCSGSEEARVEEARCVLLSCVFWYWTWDV